ncbi:hypothetical protein AFC81_13630 [Mycobacterium avium subsp. paratuberculosis]|nr:hypothetical protein RE97_17850 [Mycobacterium avium subsp. paratuberculosis]ELP48016.1 hypothetical protein D522_01801 [Mycobacterium avium subsp. paratuberculosis S5]ETB00781.1 hypothetical protein O978_19400 [Mycobacterium avium subsp. paratuberculosis 10-5864]ETB09502.1 hypothetical protein O980_18945 [Mycobacterium avium subsp. paratuberculosis 08-8281]ETB30214.1 hypothetical protein O977_17045 [Mycobacterium avium subsp. paratuberculosis 10-5975]ETB35720.1 hypothetical protein O975_20
MGWIFPCAVIDDDGRRPPQTPIGLPDSLSTNGLGRDRTIVTLPTFAMGRGAPEADGHGLVTMTAR